MHFTTQLQGNMRVASLHNCNAHTTLYTKHLDRQPRFTSAPSENDACLSKEQSERPEAKPLP